MVSRFFLFVMSLTFFSMSYSPLASARDWAKDGWEFVSEKEGIKVFRKSYPNSDVKGVAGETVVNASVGKILWILLDHAHKPEWINRFNEAYTVQEIPPSSNIQYSQFDLPFPASDRDFVFRNDFSVDPELHAVVIDVKSVVDKSVPEREGIVRGEIKRGKYFLIPQGDKTILQAEYLADPMGMIPTWLINFFQKEWPYKTLDAMRNQLKKPYVKEWEVYTKVLKPKLDALPMSASASPVSAPASISTPPGAQSAAPGAAASTPAASSQTSAPVPSPSTPSNSARDSAIPAPASSSPSAK